MGEKKEPKYLELSANCDISVEEMLQRFFCPVQAAEPSREDKEIPDDDNS